MYTHFKRCYLFIRVYVFWHPLYIDVYIYIYIYVYMYSVTQRRKSSD